MSSSPSDSVAGELSDDALLNGSELNLGIDGSQPSALESAVDVTIQKLEGRKRCLEACIDIPHACESVWDVLTDYEGLADFIPNLAESCVVGEEDGCTLLRQVGVQKLSFLKFSAAVTLKMETAPTERIDFTMVEGDFVEFFGCWKLSDLGDITRLSYAITILPPRKMPIQVVQRRLKADLSSNLSAIQQEVFRRCA
ncbi:MAG: SRPBCC family protein [Synechococcus sp.]